MNPYATITADPVIGRKIGELYLSATGGTCPETTSAPAIRAYSEFAQQVDAQYRWLVTHEAVDVWFTDHDPYADFEALRSDVLDNRRLLVWRTQDDQSHPVLDRQTNNRFRAVHDYFGHIMADRGFDRHGEEAAWVRHSQMFTGLARRAMTTETRGQSSAFIWINGGKEFPPQKAVLLPPWVSVVRVMS